MPYILVAAVAAAGGFAILRSSVATEQARSAPPNVDRVPEASVSGADLDAPGTIDGKVLEVAQVPKYTYLRLGDGGAEGTWVAVPTTAISIGAPARVRDAMKMTDFTSTALQRTFSTIYFGTLDAPQAASPRVATSGTHPSGAGAPHAPLGAVDVAAVDRATGPSGRTVAELVGHSAELAGTTVRVHATVVKATPGVLGHTYLHVRDGSGDAKAGTHDVAVTTDATPAVGDTILIEGVVAVDRDIGAGYRFPVLVENAQIVKAQ